MEVITRYFPRLLEGGFNTLLITALFSAGPLIVGILLSFLASKFPVVGKVFGWLSLPFECISVPALLLVSFYTLGHLFGDWYIGRKFVAWIAIAITFTLGFAGYMPARHVAEYTFLKNILYNGLGLIAAVFKWSFCVYLIGFTDLFNATRSLFGVTYKLDVYWIPLVVFFVVLFILEAGRRLVKQLMK